MKKIRLLIILMTGITSIISCKKDPVIPNEEELITTVKYTLLPQTGGSTIVLSFKDLDGEGGNAPVFVTSPLKAGTIYSGTLELLNEAKTPADDITPEIKNEGTEHQFFFSTTSNITVKYNDADLNGKPLGLKTLLTTGAEGAGKIKIILRHEPYKNATGVAEGNINNAGGETDVEIEFNVALQ